MRLIVKDKVVYRTNELRYKKILRMVLDGQEVDIEQHAKRIAEISFDLGTITKSQATLLLCERPEDRQLTSAAFSLYGTQEDRCKFCHNTRWMHNAVTSSCPVGKKHRTLGFTSYSNKHTFEAKPKNPLKKGKTQAVAI